MKLINILRLETPLKITKIVCTNPVFDVIVPDSVE